MLEPMKSITQTEMENAIKHGYSVSVIVNGEHYKYKTETETKERK